MELATTTLVFMSLFGERYVYNPQYFSELYMRKLDHDSVHLTLH